ncbi:uncharacterized protein LOC129572007 isoform X2 [Sitodiplosis mosellana]|nr:uncharacterized protein LOC129572007 isoform X2 [Sitodiplosis mosellana]
MGSGSRSISQEIEEPVQYSSVQQPLLMRQSAVGGSNTTLSSEYNSMSTNNDQHNLLPNTFEEEIGYENPTIMRNITDAHCYQNMQTSSSNSTISRNDQFLHDCEGNVTSNNKESSKYDEKECTVGEKLFLSNPSRSNENLIDSTAGSCDPLFANQSLEQINLEENTSVNSTNDEQECPSSIDNQNLVDDWDSHENQLQDIQDIQLQTTLDTIINNKSSKKIYKAVAKEWGITCKMSEQCRCIDCQGNYFDCEFDENDHQKTDGGLGASTPVFLNEVMHQSSCTII